MSRRNEKFRGRRTHGHGKKGRRGKGKRGGAGMAGLHKHKWSWTLKYHPKYFGMYGFTRHSADEKLKTINVWDVDRNLDRWVSEKKAKNKKNTIVVDLGELGYDKLLGCGVIASKVEITVPTATKKAIVKVEQAGGKVVTTAEDEEFPEEAGDAES